MIAKGYKCFLENFVSQKMAYVTNRLHKDERWQILLLGDCYCSVCRRRLELWPSTAARGMCQWLVSVGYYSWRPPKPLTGPDTTINCQSWWRHQDLLGFCEGNPSVTGGVPSQRPVTRSFAVSLIWAWTNGGANNRDAGDLRRYRAHYDVTVVWCEHDSRVPGTVASIPGAQSVTSPSLLFIAQTSLCRESCLLLSNIWYKPHQIPKLRYFLVRLAFVLVQTILDRCYVENEDVDGAAPTGDAPTSSEWSTRSLPTTMHLILEVWRYVFLWTYILPSRIPSDIGLG